jgi:multiple antibiotic resistance protein
MDIEFIKTAFLTMFVALDPPGLAPVFLALTAQMTQVQRKSTAYRSVVIAFCILVAAALGGKALLASLGIGIPAFRIAGGLLLFYIAAEMVFEKREQRKSQSAEAAVEQDHLQSIAAFPLAMPLMAGPGAITATILQASNAQGNWMNMAALIGILFVVLASCLIVFLLSTKIDRFLGTSGRIILSRLLGVLLAALAIQIIGDGIVAFIHTVWK